MLAHDHARCLPDDMEMKAFRRMMFNLLRLADRFAIGPAAKIIDTGLQAPAEKENGSRNRRKCLSGQTSTASCKPNFLKRKSAAT